MVYDILNFLQILYFNSASDQNYCTVVVKMLVYGWVIPAGVWVGDTSWCMGG